MKHPHIFYRIRSSKPPRWACKNSSCLAVFERHQILNKQSICTKCMNNKITMDHENLRRANPVCAFCGNAGIHKKERIRMKAASSVMEDILGTELMGAPEKIEEGGI